MPQLPHESFTHTASDLVGQTLHPMHDSGVIETLIGPADLRPATYVLGANAASSTDEQAVVDLRDQVTFAEAAAQITDGLEEIALYVDPALVRLAQRIKAGNNGAIKGRSKDATAIVPDTDHDVVAMEQRGYAKEAPVYRQQVQDETRTTPFNFYRNKKKVSAEPKTEHEGLVELDVFLRTFIAAADSQTAQLSDEFKDKVVYAKSLLENLTFIGKKEFTEAADGIGKMWKAYLEGDPNRKICVLAEATHLPQYNRPGKKVKRKSDEYLRDEVLKSFSEEDIEKYGPRVVSSIAELDSETHNTRVVLLDDWAITGGQIRSVYQKLLEDPQARRFIDANSVELNVLVASGARIENGLEINPDHPSSGSLKVRAYYRAHHAEVATDSAFAHITGLHSSVNYGFYNACDAMALMLKTPDKGATRLSLAHVGPVYRGPTAPGPRSLRDIFRDLVKQPGN